MSTSIQPVISCGGVGTRLWSLSRKAYPKQFVPLIQGKSLLALSPERVASFCAALDSPGVLCIGSEQHRFVVDESLNEAGLRGAVLLEPVARNTAAAMALAALNASRREQLLLFCSSDHHIPDETAFAQMVQQAAPAARQPGTIVTFGVMPSFPSTGYGYIEQVEPATAGGHTVRRVIEKPSREFAQVLLQCRVLWNAAPCCRAPAGLSQREHRLRRDGAACRRARLPAVAADLVGCPSRCPVQSKRPAAGQDRALRVNGSGRFALDA